MQTLTEAEIEELESRDAGIEMLREANRSFGNYTQDRPSIPPLERTGAALLTMYADELKTLAKGLKAQAARSKAQGNEMTALLLIRLQLSVEETGEWAEALASGDIRKALHELTDMQYVTDGHYLTLGCGDIKVPALRAVHAANMRKLGPDGKPIIDGSGRWVKPEGWTGAELEIEMLLAQSSSAGGGE